MANFFVDDFEQHHKIEKIIKNKKIEVIIMTSIFNPFIYLVFKH